MGDGDGVQIDHRVQCFGGGRVLGVDPGTKGTEVVAWCGGREGEGERRVGVRNGATVGAGMAMAGDCGGVGCLSDVGWGDLPKWGVPVG